MSRRLHLAQVAVLLAVLSLGQLQLTRAYYDKESHKQIARNDDTNDDALDLSAQELLNRSGYNYEEHFVIADDGYVTQLIRIINPLADRSKLKQPPVMLHHGASVDNSVYLVSSSIQHHPEAWPRTQNDEPITSSNRSLAFTLANNGYDVWLIGTRGSNEANQAFEPDALTARQDPNWRPQKSNYDFIKKNKKKYWQYGLDNIIDFELRRQIDKVRQVTGSQEVSMFSFSLSTPTTMAFLARNPDYASQVRVYIQMAPAIGADHFSTFDSLYFEKICPHLPTRGIGFFPLYSATPLVRKLILVLSRSRRVRYSLVQRFLTALFGPSLKYMSNLELNLLAHVWKSVSFKSIQHYCQNSLNKRLTRFNYGKKGNLAKYSQDTPPEHNIGQLDVQNWVVVSGTYDGLADPTTVQRLIERTSTPKPPQHIMVSGYNHLDFLGGVENARYVNLPILAALDAHSDVPKN